MDWNFLSNKVNDNNFYIKNVQAVITVDSNPMITTRIMEVRTGAYYLIGKNTILSSTDILFVMVSNMPLAAFQTFLFIHSVVCAEVLKRNILIFAKVFLRIGQLSRKEELNLKTKNGTKVLKRFLV